MENAVNLVATCTTVSHPETENRVPALYSGDIDCSGSIASLDVTCAATSVHRSEIRGSFRGGRRISIMELIMDGEVHIRVALYMKGSYL